MPKPRPGEQSARRVPEDQPSSWSSTPAPMRDKQGWRVAPAPDGRGTPAEHKPTPPHRLRGFWIFFAVLLALNWLSVLVFQPPGQPRITVPFSPYFLTQVQEGHVKSISTTGDTVQGTFTEKLRYPAGSKTATKLFSTQVPTWWDQTALSDLVEEHDVTVNANRRRPGPRCSPT